VHAAQSAFLHDRHGQRLPAVAQELFVGALFVSKRHFLGLEVLQALMKQLEFLAFGFNARRKQGALGLVALALAAVH